VVNAGVGGYNSAQELNYIALDLVHYEPDMVIVWDGNNDASIVTSDWEDVGGWIPNRVPYQVRLEQQIPILTTPKGAFDNYLHILRSKSSSFERITDLNNYYAFRMLHGIIARLNPSSQVSQKNEIAQYQYIPEATERYEQNLQSIIGICWASKIRCVILLQPVLHIPTGKPLSDYEANLKSSFPQDYMAAATKYWNVFGEIFERLHNRFHDGKNIWVENMSGVFDDEYQTTYMDHVHLSDRGQQLVAERISEIVIDMLLEAE